jgi:hypothetical protein
MFFISLISILFSGIFFPQTIFNNDISPILFLINCFTGIIVILKNKKIIRFGGVLLIVIALHFILSHILRHHLDSFEVIRLAAFSIFYVIVTYDLIKQVLQAKIINKNVIFGLMCGYFCLGLIGSFMFITIEIYHPGSFHGIVNRGYVKETNSLIYFSYVTLLTVGFGDITPTTLLARKATLITGFMGQFYMVILTAIIVGKYISQIENENKQGEDKKKP